QVSGQSILGGSADKPRRSASQSRKDVEAVHDFEQAIKLDPDKKHPAANRARLLAILTREALNFANTEAIEPVQETRRRIINQLTA
ncbi:hypothetical protein L0152_02345, partial [bacterium]|nr:hypothetical protein [bacterium]